MTDVMTEPTILLSALFQLQSMLQQVDLFDQISGLATTVSILISTVSGIVIYAITAYRKVTKAELTERDKWIMETSKAVQMTAQKSAETIGQSKEVMSIIYKANLPEADRKKIEEAIGPILEETDARLKAANEQAALIKAKAVQIFGDQADVDADQTIPRESALISSKLRAGKTTATTSAVR